MAEAARERKLPVDDKIHTWPHLVRMEFLVTLFVLVALTVWALTVDAPLEEPANPTRTPNPSKAPWYFLGLQEMLVFFDPWHAGVVLPNFNEGFSGKAPDLGCCELGQPLPHYGPRP